MASWPFERLVMEPLRVSSPQVTAMTLRTCFAILVSITGPRFRQGKCSTLLRQYLPPTEQPGPPHGAAATTRYRAKTVLQPRQEQGLVRPCRASATLIAFGPVRFQFPKLRLGALLEARPQTVPRRFLSGEVPPGDATETDGRSTGDGERARCQ